MQMYERERESYFMEVNLPGKSLKMLGGQTMNIQYWIPAGH